MSNSEKNSEISDIIDMIYSLDDISQDAELPCYVISGSGTGWFFDPETKFMVNIARGTEILPVEDLAGGKVLVRSPFNFLVIPDDEIIEIGFN